MAKDSKKLKLGAVGLGGVWTLAHSKPWLTHPEVEVVAVCDIIKEKAQHWAKEKNIPHAFTDYREMLKMDLDMIDICTPNILHSEIAVAGLEAGMRVFCEKPDAVSPEEAQKMVDAARKHKRILTVMRNNRFNPNAKFLKKYIDDGQMGDIYAARCGWIRRRGIPGKGGWFTTKALSGGGPLIDLGVHFIDLTIWLMGNPRPLAISGSTYRKFAETSVSDSVHSQFGQKVAGGTFDVEDLATGYIKFDNGASLQIEFSWASNIKQETVFSELRGSKSGATLLGETALEIFTEINGTLCDIHPRFEPPALGTHGQHLYHFVDCVQGRAQPIMKPEHGVDIVKILSAIYSSAASGKEVHL